MVTQKPASCDPKADPNVTQKQTPCDPKADPNGDPKADPNGDPKALCIENRTNGGFGVTKQGGGFGSHFGRLLGHKSGGL